MFTVSMAVSKTDCISTNSIQIYCTVLSPGMRTVMDFKGEHQNSFIKPSKHPILQRAKMFEEKN